MVKRKRAVGIPELDSHSHRGLNRFSVNKFLTLHELSYPCVTCSADLIESVTSCLLSSLFTRDPQALSPVGKKSSISCWGTLRLNLPSWPRRELPQPLGRASLTAMSEVVSPLMATRWRHGSFVLPRPQPPPAASSHPAPAALRIPSGALGRETVGPGLN